MPAIMDDDILPDMGRMAARLPWAENRGSSAGPIASDTVQPPCTVLLSPPRSMASIHRLGWLMSSPVSPPIPPIDWMSCCRGTGYGQHQPFRLRQPDRAHQQGLS